MHITLAEDDIRKQYPAYGLDLKMTPTVYKVIYYGEKCKRVRTEIFIREKKIWIEEKALVLFWNCMSKQKIVFYPYD